MQKIIDYTILEGSHQDLTRKVFQLIEKGWQPIGGVSSTVNTQLIVKCYQAMALYANEK